MPGDFGWDPMDPYTDPAPGRAEMQTKELNRWQSRDDRDRGHGRPGARHGRQALGTPVQTIVAPRDRAYLVFVSRQHLMWR